MDTKSTTSPLRFSCLQHVAFLSTQRNLWSETGTSKRTIYCNMTLPLAPIASDIVIPILNPTLHCSNSVFQVLGECKTCDNNMSRLSTNTPCTRSVIPGLLFALHHKRNAFRCMTQSVCFYHSPCERRNLTENGIGNCS